MKHVVDVYKAHQKYSGPEASKEVPPKYRELVTDLRTTMARLPEAQRGEFQQRIDDIVSNAQERDMNNKLKALAVQVGKAAAGTASGALLGPAGGVLTGALAQYYATEFENAAAKKEGGVIKKAEKVAGRRRAKGSGKRKEKSPVAEAAKAAVKSTATASVGGMGGIARSVWQGIKSLWGG